MATFHFELVSPDKISFSGEVDQVDVPGAEGDFGVLAGHAPLIALLRPGLMTVYSGGEQTKLVVLGGLQRRSVQHQQALQSRFPVAHVLYAFARAR